MSRSKLTFLLYWAVVAAVIAVLSVWAARHAPAAISDCIDATCRITTADGARGTGCVFEISRDQVYVLTAAHVVGGRQTARCEFWRQGHQSRPLAAQVVARSSAADAAVLALPVREFGGLLPAVIPLGPRDDVVRPGDTLTSVGCAHGSWSTGWKGHALGYRGSDLHFLPVPADGRSGSAIFDAAGEKIVGLLRARTGDGSSHSGIATSLQGLYQAFGPNRARAAQTEARGPAAPASLPRLSAVQGSCPGGTCPVSPTPVPWRLSPYRYRQDQREGYQDERIGRLERGLYPTLPGQPYAQPPAVGPSVDLGPTNRKLDGLNDKLDVLTEELRKWGSALAEASPPPPATPPGPPAPPADAAAREAAQEAKAEAAAVKAEVERSREETGKLRETITALLGQRETLQQRYQARVAKVSDELREELGREPGLRETARAYVKDLAAEQLSGTAGWTIGRLLAGTLGLSGPLSLAMAGGALLISRRIGHKLESGDPLLIERLLGRVSDKIDDLTGRLDDVPAGGRSQRRKAGA